MSENKEVLIQSPETGVKKTEGMTDIHGREVLPPELKPWIERIDQNPTPPIVNDANNQPLLQTSAPTNPKIILPVTRQKFIAGFKKKMDEAGRWLSTFILRLIKVKDGDVEFKKDK